MIFHDNISNFPTNAPDCTPTTVWIDGPPEMHDKLLTDEHKRRTASVSHHLRLCDRQWLPYHTGIAIQLGLSAHLLDVGFEDAWCTRHIGLHLDRSLALANASGLGLDTPPIAALTGFLSPYGQWRHADLGAAPDCPFAPAAMRSLTRALLDHVRAVTGHRLPAHGRQHRGRA